jgi:hypothetical protein
MIRLAQLTAPEAVAADSDGQPRASGRSETGPVLDHVGAAR